MTEYIYIIQIHPLDDAEFRNYIIMLNRLLVKDKGESLSVSVMVKEIDNIFYPEYKVNIVEWDFMRNHLKDVLETLIRSIRCEIINQYKNVKLF